MEFGFCVRYVVVCYEFCCRIVLDCVEYVEVKGFKIEFVMEGFEGKYLCKFGFILMCVEFFEFGNIEVFVGGLFEEEDREVVVWDIFLSKWGELRNSELVIGSNFV